MPRFKKERSLSRAPRRNKEDRNALAPRPVHPRALANHGFFGVSYVRQHLIVDSRWSPNSLAEQFGGMTQLLERHAVFNRHKKIDHLHRIIRESKRLKLQCRLGRTKLQSIMVGNNKHRICNILTNHKDMQRLFQRMPIHLIADNVNQHTFVMRKERDRLQFRLTHLKNNYREMLLKRAMLENRIKYQNEFVLEEEIKSQGFIKRIENSNVRLKAIKAINTTYQKMIQVLRHDAIFYDPILRSLDEDMEDQANFIKHILYLGMPAIAQFRELGNQYHLLEVKSRKNFMEKQRIFASLQNDRKTESLKAYVKQDGELPKSANPKRYVRETRSMMVLKNVFKVIENIIKEVKLGTLSSQAREIYPRLKSQTEKNQKLKYMIIYEKMKRTSDEVKSNIATVLQGVLINNLSQEEIDRLERIKNLRNQLAEANEAQEEIAEHIKYRADAFVMFRTMLWNLVEILGNVQVKQKTFETKYKSSYLKLPLLKFEMLASIAVPPDLYEVDVEKIMNILKRKVYKIMQIYKADMESTLISSKEKYHADYLNANYKINYIEDDDQQGATVGDVIIQDQKSMFHVPSRKQIKAHSNRIVEDAAKLLDIGG